MLLTVIMAFAGAQTARAQDTETVSYIDENGTEQTITDYYVLTGNETVLGSEDQTTWYVVKSNISYSGKINCKGNVNIILADGKTEYYVNAFRAYFHVSADDAQQGSALVRSFVLNFGDASEEAQGIRDNKREPITNKHDADAWYTLDGVRLDGVGAGPVPARLRKGLYIHGGKKVMVK